MLRVLQIDTMKGWRGGERQAWYLAKGLLNLGHRVGFACEPDSELDRGLRGTGVHVHPVRFRCEADFTAAWRMANLIRNYKYQVLHMHDSHAHWLGGCAARLSGKPLRIVSRRVDFSIHRHGFGLSIIKYRHFADAFIAVSSAVKDALVHDGVPEEMIHVVYSGVDISPLEKKNNRRTLNRLLGANGTTKIVGTVGSLVGHKGHRYFVESAAEILKAMPDVRFVIIGEGKLRRDLESRIEKKGLSGKFFLAGHRTSAAQLLAAFDVFVMPSVMEGLGTSLLDAMAAGVPVVAARAGGIPEVVEDLETGLLVKPGDARSLADAVKKILHDQNLARTLTRRARTKVAREFEVERMVEKTDSLYKTLLSGRR